MLAHRNGVPELMAYHPKPLTTCFSFYLPNTKIERLGTFKQNYPFFGAHGSYSCNVPQGKYALVYFGQIAKLLGPGAHVIKDPTFRLSPTIANDEQSAFIDMFSSHIRHHTIHIIRVPVGQVAKCWINTTTPHLLYPRADGSPAVVNDALFRFDQFVSQLAPVIQHGITSILRIPAGHLCKAWKGSQAIILESRAEPYEFHDALFRVDNPKQPFSSMNEPYIRHMSLHRLRIPAGKLAKVWQQNTPLILQSQEEAYEFDSPFFRLAPADPTAIDGDRISTDPTRLFEGQPTRTEHRLSLPRRTLLT